MVGETESRFGKTKAPVRPSRLWRATEGSSLCSYFLVSDTARVLIPELNVSSASSQLGCGSGPPLPHRHNGKDDTSSPVGEGLSNKNGVE